jgi:hypothetical protein
MGIRMPEKKVMELTVISQVSKTQSVDQAKWPRDLETYRYKVSHRYLTPEASGPGD